MASNKKSFVLYTDLIHTVNQLPDDKAGLLFKHILSYVNDENPISEDIIVNISFEPIKQQLKRDLVKYEAICERNKINGQKGGRPKITDNQDDKDNPKEPKKPSGLFGNPEEPKKPDNDNDNDNESDIDNVKKEKEIVFNFRKELLNLGIEKQIVEDWLKVRKTKNASNTQTALNSIIKQIELSKLTASECIKISVENSWSGFKSSWLDTLEAGTNGQTSEQIKYKNATQAEKVKMIAKGMKN